MMTMHTNYFHGNKVSNYGIEHHRVDYGTLAKAFDAVLNNEIMQKTMDISYWEQVSGFINNTEEIEELQEKIEEIEGKAELIMSENEIAELKKQIEELEEQIAQLEEEQEYSNEIYQYYIVSDNGAKILEEINEIVFYNEELDMYIWGVTHWGTSWDYVLTDIKICEYDG